MKLLKKNALSALFRPITYIVAQVNRIVIIIETKTKGVDELLNLCKIIETGVETIVTSKHGNITDLQ